MAAMFGTSIDRNNASKARSPARRLLGLLFLALCLAAPATAWSSDLHEAVRQGDVDSVLALLANDEDISETDFVVGPPLLLAIVEGHRSVAEA